MSKGHGFSRPVPSFFRIPRGLQPAAICFLAGPRLRRRPLRRPVPRPYRQPALLNQLHRLGNRHMHRPALIHKWLLGIENLVFRLQQVLHVHHVVGLQPRLRKTRRVHASRVFEVHALHLGWGHLPRIHHRTLVALCEEWTVRQEAEHPPEHQFDKDAGHQQSHEKHQDPARAEIAAVVVNFRISEQIEVVVITGHVPTPGATNLLSAARKPATTAAAAGCKRRTPAIARRSRLAPRGTRG